MLPSPIIQGTLPAFYADAQNNGNAIITIPFTMSRAVHQSQVKGFRLKLKNIQGSGIITTLDSYEIDFNNSVAYFELKAETLNAANVFQVGSFYKAQIAYTYSESESSREIYTGYYSTVGVIKYTSKPKITILNLNKSGSNAHIHEYTGQYSQENGDPTEKVYSYRFVVTDLNEKIIEDTGFLIHNNSNDTEQNQSKDTFVFNYELEENKKYMIQYTVKTNNGLELSSPIYKIVGRKNVITDFTISIIPTLNYDNGYVLISLKGEENKDGYEIPVMGSFVLSRASEKTNYSIWEEIDYFDLNQERPSIKYWKDCTIKQGEKYKYSIQQYNQEKMYSERIVSQEIYSDFEHCFLYDGKRQLKIKFNPKISSFKKNLFEAKVDTIGSKYPFIFRNGQVEYKEFPISGLISLLSDEESMFFTYEEEKINEREDNLHNNLLLVRESLLNKAFYLNNLNQIYVKINVNYQNKWENARPIKKFKYIPIMDYYKNENLLNWDKMYPILLSLVQNKTLYYNSRQIEYKSKEYNLLTDLTSSNIYKEREFKLEVLDWLTNGEPKLFRSPNEGNYLVRLMNVSLSPNDQLGRMLHTFSATAYEVADVNYEALVKFNIISISNLNNKYIKFKSIALMTQDENKAKLNSHITYIEREQTDPVTNTTSYSYHAVGELLNVGEKAETLYIEDLPPNATIFSLNGNSIFVGLDGFYNCQVPVTKLAVNKGLIPINEYKPEDADFYYIRKSNSNIFQKYIRPEEAGAVKDIYYYNDILPTGIVSFSYYGTLNSTFSNIMQTNTKDIAGKQFIGAYIDLKTEIENIARKIVSFYNIKAYKRPIYDLFDCGEGNLRNEFGQVIAEFDGRSGIVPGGYLNGIHLKNLDFQDKMIIYRYKKSSLDNLYKENLTNPEEVGQPLELFVPVIFDKTEYGDQGKFPPHDYTNENDLYAYESLRNSINRSTTNPYLLNIRDYRLYVDNEKLYTYDNNNKQFVLIDKSKILDENDYGENNRFFIKEDFILYHDSYQNKTYYDIDTLKKLESMMKLTGRKAENYFYSIGQYENAPFESYFSINNGLKIDLSDIESYETGSLNDVLTLKTTPGIYCELYYQEQNLEYDISKNAYLKELKSTLDFYDKILSEEYMIEMCIETDSAKEYIEQLETVYNNYKAVYELYIFELTQYLERLEEEK